MLCYIYITDAHNINHGFCVDHSAAKHIFRLVEPNFEFTENCPKSASLGGGEET